MVRIDISHESYTVGLPIMKTMEKSYMYSSENLHLKPNRVLLVVRRDISLDLQDDISYLEVEAGRCYYVRANGPVSAVKAYIRPQPNRNIEFYWWLDETFR